MKRKGIVLPSLIMLTLVMVLLCAVLVSSGTAGLRMASHASHGEQALYAAEAGLVQVAARFARGEGSEGTSSYSGKLKTEGVSYAVTAVMNKSRSESKTTPEGVSVPPQTTYLRSVGTAADGTQRVMGALFTLGAGSFRAGVVADRIHAEGSHFVAYDSRVNLAPDLTDHLATSQGILTSNKLGTPVIDPQFSFLNDSTVLGDVYTAKGTVDPSTQIEGIDSVTGHVGILDEKIEIPEIRLPRVDRGESSDPDDDPNEQGDLTEGPYTIEGISSSSLQAEWTGTQWLFKHYRQTARSPQNESYGGPYRFQRPNGSFTDEYVTVGSNGEVFFHNGGHGDHNGKMSVSLPPSALNPPTLKDGSYKKIRVNDDNETKLQEGGVFVVEDLEITNGGKLALTTDSPVTIYVTNSMKVEGENAIANSSRKPPNLKIYYLGTQDVNLAGGSEAYFTLVAPKANINLIGEAPIVVVDPTAPDPNAPSVDPTATPTPTDLPTPTDPAAPTSTATTSFYGALVGKNVTVKNANFFFDVATDGVGEGSDSNTFVLLSRHRI